MTTRPPARDGGAAAVETALCMLMLLVLVGLVAPLPVLLAQQDRLEQAAGRTIRWTTSAPGGVRPTQAGVVGEARRAFTQAGGASDAVTALRVVTPPRSGPAELVLDPNCPNGRARQIVLQTDLDLRPYGDLLGVLGISTSTRTLKARATSCEE